MAGPAAELARRLAREAEAVCRHYLPHGRREGRYWRVGDVFDTPGRSLYVRLHGPDTGPGAAGHWTDAATGEHGDLLDLIRLGCGLPHLAVAMADARAFLALPRPAPPPSRLAPAPRASPEAARRLFAAGRPVPGTLAEAYLRRRGITARLDTPALRFHPACFTRPAEDAPRQAWPALLAAVTALDGRLTGVHRTWLDPARTAKAPLPSPRRALGALLGHGVRFGSARDVLAAGEGLETVLSLISALPGLPAVAALSASHLAALALPMGLGRLYVARDDDAAGRHAAARLRDRAAAAGIEVRELVPGFGDFNDDLCRLGIAGLLGRLAPQLAAADLRRFAGAGIGPAGRRPRPGADG